MLDNREITIAELIDKAQAEKVRIEIEIIPDGYGLTTERINIEPWVPFESKCPYGTPVVYVKGKEEED